MIYNLKFLIYNLYQNFTKNQICFFVFDFDCVIRTIAGTEIYKKQTKIN